jgi:hypothetical protein
MPSNAQTGTQTATISTRHQLGTTVSTAGVYVLKVDTGNMANGDALTLEVESKSISGGTRRVSQRLYFANAQAAPVKELVPEPEVVELAVYLTQTAGTGRAFDWAIVSL